MSERAGTDAIVIGGGPIGIEMAIALQSAGLTHILIEGRQIGDAISRWPPNTHFYSTPEHVALAGIPVHNTDQLPVTGEQYLAYLRTLVEQFDLNLYNYETVTAIERDAGEFIVHTKTLRGEHAYRCSNVILATGGMARPRLLGIPGEQLPHVSHYFPGPHTYFRTRLLVVGGKNSALESALRSWRAGADVAISYRRPGFDFDVVKPHLGDDMSTRLEKEEITFFPSTIPVEITATDVVLATTDDGVNPNGHTFRHEADFVLLATGFEADMSLLASTGIELRGEEQAPVYDPGTMETNIPGIYVAGTAAAGTQQKFTHFISTSHDHVAKIIKAITGRVPRQLGTVEPRNNAVTWDEVKAN